MKNEFRRGKSFDIDCQEKFRRQKKSARSGLKIFSDLLFETVEDAAGIEVFFLNVLPIAERVIDRHQRQRLEYF